MTDLISRADAIEAVRMSEHRITIADEQGGFGTVKWDMYGVYTAEAVEALKALPSADAVYGKWLPIEETIPTYDGGEKTWITGMKCSNCGKLFDLRVGYYYCPSCGAKMKGGTT